MLSTINLLDPKADLEPLIGTIGDLADAGRPVNFLVVDTFSRALADGEENGSIDWARWLLTSMASARPQRPTSASCTIRASRLLRAPPSLSFARHRH